MQNIETIFIIKQSWLEQLWDRIYTAQIIDALFEIEGGREISEVTGRFDIMVTMYAKTLNEMHKVVSEKIGKIDGILSSESFIEMKRRAKPMPYYG